MHSSFFSRTPGLNETLDCCLKELVFRPYDADAHIDCAHLCMEHGQEEKGIEIARNALEIDAANEKAGAFFKRYYVVQDCSAFHFLNYLSDEELGKGFLYRVFFRFKEEQYDKMLEDANSLMAIRRGDVNALYCCALAYFNLGKPYQGLSHINEALKQSPTRIELYMARARYYCGQGHAYKMLRDFMAILQIHEARGDMLWKNLYDGIQSGSGGMIALIIEHDKLKEKKESANGWSEDDVQRYEEITHYLKEQFSSVGSLDTLRKVPSLVSIVGSLLYRNPDLVQQRFMLGQDLRESIECLDRRIVKSYSK